MASLCGRGTKVYKDDQCHMTRWPSFPYNKEIWYVQHLVLVPNRVCIKRDLGMTLTFLWQGQNWSHRLFNGEIYVVYWHFVIIL